jgi:anti-anti-sigma factor
MRADADPSGYHDSVFQIQQSTHRGWARLTMSGELDISTALTFRRRLRAFRARNTPVHLDLSQVEFMDSMGARAVLDAVAASRGSTWRVEVEPPLSHQPRRCFDLARGAGRYQDL